MWILDIIEITIILWSIVLSRITMTLTRIYDEFAQSIYNEVCTIDNTLWGMVVFTRHKFKKNL